MDTKKILNEIIEIQPNNLFLQYIVERIQDNNYRGLHISQHNRYNLERLSNILNGVYEIVKNNIFRVPLGDDTGQGDPDCKQYYDIVKSVYNKSGIGTTNSLKKNFFVDFQRMGLLNRYDKKKNLIPFDKRGHIFYAQLTERAIKLITTSSIAEKYKIFTDALDDLFSKEISDIAETLYYSKYRNDPIGIYEFMLILSDDRDIDIDKIELINSYRSLKRWQQDKAIKLIKDYCNPDNFVGNKTTRRDFYNWKNESQQIFTLLKNTVYFDITQNSLRLNTGRYGIFNDDRIKQRKLGAKLDYLKNHKLEKIKCFEIHHVVPFSSARNKVEFQLIDNWKNMIYLHEKKHEEITKNGNRNVILCVSIEQIYFDDFNKNRIIAQNGIDVVYSGKLSNKMQKYNKEILKEIFNLGK